MWVLALLLLVLAIGLMHWGASQAASIFRNVCRRLGLTAAGGATLLGLATASPEITVNVAAVAFGWPDIGLGTALGSNAPALPLIFLLSWLAGRHTPPEDMTSVAVKEEASYLQALPYLCVIALLAAMTVPSPVRGLQWPDAIVLIGGYGVYVAQALMRGRKRAAPDCRVFEEGGHWRLCVAPVAIAGGAVVAVVCSNYLVEHFGITPLIGGLFITGLLCALPESFAAWTLARRGQATAAVSGAMADGTASLTVAFLALGMAQAPIGNLGLYSVHLAFLAVVLAMFIVMAWRGGTYISGGSVTLMAAAYAVYIGAVFLTA